MEAPMEWPDITREDEARWPDETRVMMDQWDVRVWSCAANARAVKWRERSTRPYEMVDRDGRPSLFGREAYEAWAGNPAINTDGVFRLEHLERGMRIWRARQYPDCPLCGCEDFEGQRLVPRHLQRIGASDLTFGSVPAHLRPPPGFTYLGNAVDPGADERTALMLAAAINVPPRVLRFRNGAELTIHSEYVEPGDVVTLNGQQFRVGDLLEDPTPAYAAMELPRVELRTGAQMAELTARQHLERARPRRRLDGRR